MSCLSASTFTVPATGKRSTRRQVTNAYRQVHLLYHLSQSIQARMVWVTNAYRQVHLLYYNSNWQEFNRPLVTNAYRQVHLLYHYKDFGNVRITVTNAYRQVHLLYQYRAEIMDALRQSQMPIGKYIYCTELKAHNEVLQSHKCLSASTFTVHEGGGSSVKNDGTCHKCLSASTFTVHSCSERGRLTISRSQMPIGKYIYCTQHRVSGIGWLRMGHKCLSASTFTVHFLWRLR